MGKMKEVSALRVPWVLVNIVRFSNERLRGGAIDFVAAGEFIDAIFKCGLSEIALFGSRFT